MQQSEQARQLRRVRQKIDPFVHAWCELRARDGREFNGEDMYAYVRACCAEHGLSTKDDSIRRAMSGMKKAGVVEYTNTNRRAGTYVVTVARGLDYVKPVEEPGQLSMWGAA